MKKKTLILYTLLFFALVVFLIFRGITKKHVETPDAPSPRRGTVSPSANTSGIPDTKNLKKRSVIELRHLPLNSDSMYPQPFKQAGVYLQNDPTDPKQLPEMAHQLELPDLSEADSVEALRMLLFSCRQLANGGHYEIDSNVEVTNALLGDNLKKIAFISDKTSRINEDGELIDVLGNPYQFHLISSKRLTIRSAGLDEELYTEDDVVSASPEELKDGIPSSLPGIAPVMP